MESQSISKCILTYNYKINLIKFKTINMIQVCICHMQKNKENNNSKNYKIGQQKDISNSDRLPSSVS